ncbi:hypothetical protein CC79DRAFT_1329109 [Sarocladium strictum]
MGVIGLRFSLLGRMVGSFSCTVFGCAIFAGLLFRGTNGRSSLSTGLGAATVSSSRVIGGRWDGVS